MKRRKSYESVKLVLFTCEFNPFGYHYCQLEDMKRWENLAENTK